MQNEICKNSQLVKSWRFRTAEIQNRCQYLTCWNETWTFRQMRDNIFISCVQRHQTHSLHSSCYARLTPALYVQHTDMRLIILLMSHTQKTTQHFYFPKCWIFPLKSSSESLPDFWKTNFTFETLHLFLIVKLNFRRWKWDMFHSETRFLSRHFKALEITFFRLCESGPKSSVLTVVVSFRAECNNQRCSCAAGLQPAVVSSEGLRPSAPSRAQVCVRVCVWVCVMSSRGDRCDGSDYITVLVFLLVLMHPVTSQMYTKLESWCRWTLSAPSSRGREPRWKM